jgi:dTDP-4-dehydrorhamnose 3,5-epimerase-like enzyme
MSKIISIPTFSDNRGSISIIEKFIDFKIKRVYYLYNFTNFNRAQHKHIKNIQFVICIKGEIILKVINKKISKYRLNNPKKGVLLEPNDWHEIIPKIKKSIVLVLASEFYDKKDYINEI